VGTAARICDIELCSADGRAEMMSLSDQLIAGANEPAPPLAVGQHVTPDPWRALAAAISGSAVLTNAPNDPVQTGRTMRPSSPPPTRCTPPRVPDAQASSRAVPPGRQRGTHCPSCDSATPGELPDDVPASGRLGLSGTRTPERPSRMSSSGVLSVVWNLASARARTSVCRNYPCSSTRTSPPDPTDTNS
jgi:hypothetical protein